MKRSFRRLAQMPLRFRTSLFVVASLLAAAMLAAPASATHLNRVIDCGEAGVFDLEPIQLPQGTENFQVPPRIRLRPLAGTTQVFVLLRAIRLDGQVTFDTAGVDAMLEHNPNIVTCANYREVDGKLTQLGTVIGILTPEAP